MNRRFLLWFSMMLFIALMNINPAFANADKEMIPEEMMEVTATSEKAFEKASNVLDKDPSSHWKSSEELPQSITLSFARPLTITELHYTPKVGDGVIEQYEVSISTDGKTFEKIVEGSWDETIESTQTIVIDHDQPVAAVQLTALSSSDDGAAAVELAATTTDQTTVEAYVDLLQAIDKGEKALLTSRVGFGAEEVAIEKSTFEAVLSEATAAAKEDNNSTDQDIEQSKSLSEATEQFISSIRSIHQQYLQVIINQAKEIEASGDHVDSLKAVIDQAEQMTSDHDATVDEIDAAISQLINATVQADPNQQWIGAWATAMHAPFGGDSEGFNNWTIRQIVYPTTDGEFVRFRFSNEFGDRALTLDKVGVALSDGGAAIVSDSHREVTFDGNTSVSIPAGQEIWSDPVKFNLNDNTPIAISTYVSNQTGPTTWHMRSMQTTYFAPTGDFTENDDGSPYRLEQDSWFWLSGVEVVTDDPDARVIVALGDSITDGAGGSVNTNNRWPDHLNKLLNETYPDASISILNAGISGNRVLGDTSTQGESAINRLQRDVFAHAGVTDIILLEGINDIGNIDDLTAEQLIDGYKKIIQAAHERDIRVIGATLTPFRGFADGYFTEEKEQTRQAVNEWIRTTDLLAGVIDFDKIIEDPNNLSTMLPAYDSGDHLHPSDEGYVKMGQSVDPTLFDPTGSFEQPSEQPDQPTQPEDTKTEPKEEPTDEGHAQQEEQPNEQEPEKETLPQDEDKADEPVIPDMPKTGMGGTTMPNTASAWLAVALSIIIAITCAGLWRFIRNQRA